jgi:CRP-like cAMP-binding protein
MKLQARFKIDFQPLQKVALTHLQLLASEAESLSNLPVFQECEAEFLQELAEKLERRMFITGENIVTQGEDGDSMYIIARGKVNVMKGGMQLAMMCAGACFGELAVLGICSERAATVVCATPCDIQMLARDSLLSALDHHPAAAQAFLRRISYAHGVDKEVANEKVLNLPLFEPFSRDFLDKIAGSLEERNAFPGQIFIQNGAKSEAMFIVVRGSVLIEKARRFDTVEVPAPCIVGEVGFLTKRPYAATVRAMGLCNLRVLHREIFLSFLQDFPKDKRVFDNLVQEQSREHKPQVAAFAMAPAETPSNMPSMGSLGSKRGWHVDFFCKSAQEFLEFLSRHLAKCIFYSGQVIFREGDMGDYGLLLQVGAVKVEIKGQEVAKLQENSFFGEMCMLGITDKRTATVQATSTCIIHTLHKTVLLRALEDFPEERLRFCNMVHARGAVVRMLCRGDYDQQEFGEKPLMNKIGTIPALKQEADSGVSRSSNGVPQSKLSMEMLSGKGNFYLAKPQHCIIEEEVDHEERDGDDDRARTDDERSHLHRKNGTRKLHVEQIREWINRRQEAVENAKQRRDMRLIRRGHMCMILPESCGYLNSDVEPHSLVADSDPRELGEAGKSIATFRRAHLPALMSKDQPSLVSESRIRSTKRIYGRRVWEYLSTRLRRERRCGRGRGRRRRRRRQLWL